MIKRRFYKLEHGDRDAPSESSSSDDSEFEAEASEEEAESEEEDDNNDDDAKEEEDDGVARLTGGNESSSGYESEDSSANEVNLDSSVYKCRVCPRIVCLTVQTLLAHLTSKRHARSVKLLKEGRLKLMLSEKGKIEGEILPEEEDSPIAWQDPSRLKKKSKGMKRQLREKKYKKNKENFLPAENARESRMNQSRKRQKNK
ncbi:uncharacterized protein LOC132035787 isoform X3 [Lycium ferocissimum]|uniref:uncharacterized protein LOC132035787 isoform X3 n=1 Tax=Lycium ferocissimum TaxID=112874 RepID=UPI0028150FED|nr:uncharacterized protein LOC132035787 isoform X3 [Lycium ferocissimum]